MNTMRRIASKKVSEAKSEPGLKRALAKWLEKSAKELIAEAEAGEAEAGEGRYNDDLIGNGYAAVLYWLDGYGDDPLDTDIYIPGKPDVQLHADILKMPEGRADANPDWSDFRYWQAPSDEVSGDVFDGTSVGKENFDDHFMSLADYLMGIYENHVAEADECLGGKERAKGRKPKTEAVMEYFEPVSSFKTWEYADRSLDGYEIVKTFVDCFGEGRLYAVVNMGESAVHPYLVGIGYSPDDGTWNQGRYGFDTAEDAERWLRARYDVRPYSGKPVKEGIESELKGYIDWCAEKGLRPQDAKNLKAYLEWRDGPKDRKESKAKKPSRPVNEGWRDSKYEDAIQNALHSWHDDFLDIVANVLERIEGIEDLNDDDVYENVIDAMNDELIYDEDRWTIMQEYQSPDNADLDSALDDFADDVQAVIREIKG